MNNDTKFLGIDYGDVRVGIAVSDESKKFSFNRGFMTNDTNLLTKIAELVRVENISKIVLGYPLNFNSEKTIQTLKVEKFKEQLEKFLKNKMTDAEIVYFDERLTSKLAEASIQTSGLRKSKRRDKGLVDSVAATIILQDFLDSSKNIT